MASFGGSVNNPTCRQKTSRRTAAPHAGLAVDSTFGHPITKRLDAVKEVGLSQARNKAVEKLGVGIGGEAEKHPGVTLFKPWFTTPELEEEYRSAAYTLQRKQITRIIFVMSFVYIGLFIVEFSRKVVDPNEIYSGYIVMYIFLRVFSAISAFLIAFEMRRKVLHHHDAMRLCLLQVMLFALIPSLKGDSDASSEPRPTTYATEFPGEFLNSIAAAPLFPLRSVTLSMLSDESFELMSIYIIAYSMLVPIFPIRFVGTAMVALTALQESAFCPFSLH